MQYVLAVDSGGTKCEALLVRADGTALGWSRVDAENPASGQSHFGSGRSKATVAQAVQQALGDHHGDELITVGFSRSLPHGLPEERFAKFTPSPVQECDPAFAIAGETAGMVILAGTGAVVVGRTRDGQELRLDGLGPVLGDFGGGFHIGLLAIQAAAKSCWHPRHATSLTDVVRDGLGIEKITHGEYDFVRYMMAQHDRSALASLARLVDAEAHAGDTVAQRILRQAAEAIAETVWDIADRLGIAGDAYPVIGMGSVATRSTLYWSHFSECVRAFAPKFSFKQIDFPPAAGMALIALQRLGREDPQELRKTLFGSLRELWQNTTGPTSAETR